MFEYRTHNALVKYLIDNQEKYFDFKIIRGESLFAFYRDEQKKKRTKLCDAIGISKDTIYIIEVKTRKIVLKNIRDYIKYIGYFMYSFKKIKILFIAPKITKDALKELEKFDLINYRLIDDVYFNNELENEWISQNYADNDFQYKALWYINTKLRPYLNNIDRNIVTINDEPKNEFIEIEFRFASNIYRIQAKLFQEHLYFNCLFQIIKRVDGIKTILVPYKRISNIDYIFRILEHERRAYTGIDQYKGISPKNKLVDDDMSTIVKLADSIERRFCNFNYNVYTYIKD